jgi:MFS family permease
LPGAEYHFKQDEQPGLPSSPFSPAHPLARRIGYAAVAVQIGITATLGNALVAVNIGNLSGALGVYVAEANWLPAIYIAMYAWANLVLFKARIQFGIPQVTSGLLILYALAALGQFVVPGFGAAIVLRAVSGLAAAALTTLAVYYLFQSLSPKRRPLSLAIGIAFPQLGVSLARLFPVEMLALGGWRGLHMIETALALMALAAIWRLPLPPSIWQQAFEPLDLLTAALLLPAITLLAGVLSQGRLLWWTDTPWLGWALAASIPLFMAAIMIERCRARPLLHFEWIGSIGILRFAAVAFLVRLALAEQTYGSVGFLFSGGLTNDQLHGLFAVVSGAIVLGMLVVAVTLSQSRLLYLVMSAALCITLGAWLDSQGNNLTRIPQLYFSQALIGFGTSLFIGPSLLYGFIRMTQRGPNMLISFVVLFSVTQNIGSLAGSALLSSYQFASASYHAQTLSEHLVAANPQVTDRIRDGAAAVASAITDPAQRIGTGSALLGRAEAGEANVLAFNDVFQLVALLALLTAIYVAYLILLGQFRRQRQIPVAARQ